MLERALDITVLNSLKIVWEKGIQHIVQISLVYSAIAVYW